ncbi:MAG: hypothetical protein PHC66_02830 [Candidatus Nanoarchaeia archaeon]|nr:hypothetical protein [Candidatus Nanoarchaeia archaeon]MDD5238998.1 hypothetical protein [Candidatus Nanoarchaeia archaeon]
MKNEKQACPLPTITRIHKKKVAHIFPCKKYFVEPSHELRCSNYEQCHAYKAYMMGKNGYNVLSEIYERSKI